VHGVELRLTVKKRQKEKMIKFRLPTYEDTCLWQKLSVKERECFLTMAKPDLEILRELGLYVSDEEMEKAP